MSKSAQEYLGAYQQLHAGEAGFLINGVEHRTKKLFDGSNFVDKLLEPFETAVDQHPQRAVRVLDYGCGKATHLQQKMKAQECTFLEYMEPHTVQVYWCYDPGFLPYSTKPPVGSFDIVICADVMEHVPEEEVDNTLREIKSMIDKTGVVLFTISCKKAVKHFADGENLHCTVQPVSWWKERLNAIFDHRTHLLHVVFETPEENVVWKNCK